MKKESRVVELPEGTIPLILEGDVLDNLKKISDKSINVVVTSPPYWNLRDYEAEGQIGEEEVPEEYIKRIADIGDEIEVPFFVTKSKEGYSEDAGIVLGVQGIFDKFNINFNKSKNQILLNPV